MYFRNARRTSSSLTRASEKGSKKIKTDHVAMAENARSSPEEAESEDIPDPVALKRNPQLLKTTPEKDVSAATFVNLLEETHETRKDFIKESISIKDVVETCQKSQTRKLS